MIFIFSISFVLYCPSVSKGFYIIIFFNFIEISFPGRENKIVEVMPRLPYQHEYRIVWTCMSTYRLEVEGRKIGKHHLGSGAAAAALSREPSENEWAKIPSQVMRVVFNIKGQPPFDWYPFSSYRVWIFVFGGCRLSKLWEPIHI